MDRLKEISRIEDIQYNIKFVEKRISMIETDPYYSMFGQNEKKVHRLEIQKKCLAFWKRKFNKLCKDILY